MKQEVNFGGKWTAIGSKTGTASLSYDASKYSEICVRVAGFSSTNYSIIIPVTSLAASEKLFPLYEVVRNGSTSYIYCYISTTSIRLNSHDTSTLSFTAYGK